MLHKTVFLKNLGFSLIVLIIFSLVSCDSDDIGDNYVTFTGEMMGTHFINNPDNYSEFTKMLDTTGVLSLLNTYGKYTCFAPTNSAIFEFYESKGRTELNEFHLDTIKKIVHDHIIEEYIYNEEDFVEGRLGQLSMSNRYISISYVSNDIGRYGINVNKTAPVLESNIEVYNGVIHALGQVLSPTELTLVETIAANSKLKLFSEALVETGLFNKLDLVEDKTYDPTPWENSYEDANTWRLGTLIVIPQLKKYGYTALVESDSVFKVNGINSLDDMIVFAKNVYDAMYPEDAGITDLKNPKNSLNRFIAYHLINKQISYSKFIIDYDKTIHSIKLYDMFEFIEPMCPNTLIEVRTLRTASRTTLFNYNSSTGECIEIIRDRADNDAVNGVYHEIDGILSYNSDVVSEISSRRLRIDAASFFPELANNNMRGRGNEAKLRYIIPPGYVDRLWLSERTKFYYLTTDDRLAGFQGDEFWLKGLYDFKITTPVIPAGTYEVRMGYQPNSSRGVAQLYWDGVPCGIPLDLRLMANNPAIGYQTPGTDPEDLNGFENDKMMRNRGYMKGPASYRSNGGWYPDSEVNARLSLACLRKVLGIYTFDETKEHEFSVKAVKEGQFQIDFIEFVPTEIIEREGIE